ncbi:BlaI/MecI/CopY family transcriptional regulator [Dyella sp. A6]|uniref:BlaI/MecI/CopY family transcriptional regulator n=1 Tax=Dyella aluminiiresistens TaxID=3069105 RepID=UPI002E77E099|nr:BlaI/MecI/CopY family transcriptional regulator [Dyella sp. A6]
MSRYSLPADDLEYAVLSSLWALGTASVRDLHERVGVPAGYVYTTTAKVVDRLREKRLVERRRDNSAFVYRPTVERAEVERVRARQLMGRFLGPEPQAAVAALVDAVGEIDPDLLEQFEQAIRDRKALDRGP